MGNIKHLNAERLICQSDYLQGAAPFVAGAYEFSYVG
jgi:hypothetical protein